MAQKFPKQHFWGPKSLLQQGCSRRRKKERILKRENRLYKQGQTRSKEGAKSTYFIRKAATARLWFCLGRRAPQHQKGRGAARSIRTACPTLLDLSTVLTPFHRVRQNRRARRQKGKKYERPPEHGAAAPAPVSPRKQRGTQNCELISQLNRGCIPRF